MTYKEAFRLIRSDYLRYRILSSGRHPLFRILIAERGFKYSIFIRLAAVKGVLKPFFMFTHHLLSTRYSMQISPKTKIGTGLYIGHGVGIVINSTAIIGNNVTLSQFLSIGANRGKAAIIEDNVYIGPGVCILEDVIIGHNCMIGAGAVVTKSCPPYSIIAGIPAKVIRTIEAS